MKHLLWKKDTTTQQKWVIVILMVSLLGAMCAIFTRSFVPSTEWIQASLLICAVLCAAAGFMLRKFYREGTWQPGEPWLAMGLIKRIFMFPLMVLTLFAFLWMAIVSPLPSLYTHYWGQDAESASEVTAHRNSGRHGCRYQFKVAEIQFWIFEFCIDEEDYDALKGKTLYAKLQSKQSFFGNRYESLVLVPPSAETVRASGLDPEAVITYEDGSGQQFESYVELTDPQTGKTKRIFLPPPEPAP